MSIELSAFLQTEDITKEYLPEIGDAGVKVDGIEYALTFKEPLRLIITSLGGGRIKIVYTCKATAAIPCARCLKPVDTLFVIKGTCEADLNDPDESDSFFIDKTVLYPEALLLDEILMQWPIRVLCKEDCKGICSNCGADLNAADCGCDRKTPDLQMSAIKDIFSQYKEV